MKFTRALLIVTCVTVLPVTPAFSQAQAPAGKAPAAPAPAAPKTVKPTDVVLWIGNEAITAERFDALLRAVPPQYEGAVGALGKKQFANNYGMLRGLAMHAEKEKLDQSATFQDQLAFVRMELLARLAFGEISRFTQVVLQEEIQKHFKEHEAEYQQAKVRGIFISLTPPSKSGDSKDQPKTRTDAEAREIALKLREKILAGADFATVAKESSEDPATGAKGGDFGTVRKGQLPPNMDKVVFSLKPKEVSEPVPEARGYYLFTVEEVRVATLDEATPAIRNQLQQQKFTAALEKVKVDFPVRFNDDYFEQQPSPAAPPAKPAPPKPAPNAPPP